MANYKLYFDGSCGPKNPGGTAAFGFVLFREGQQEPVEQGSGVIGTGEGMTNNLAEFYALWRGLTAFWKVLPGRGDTLTVYGDSNLVIQIMSHNWRAKKDKPYYQSYAAAEGCLKDIRKLYVSVSFFWVPRELNQVCDDLSKAHQKKVCQNDQNSVDKLPAVC